MDINYLPLTDMRIARTFCFTNGGQALYLSSPTEIQRITFSQEMCDNLQVSTDVTCSSMCVHSVDPLSILYIYFSRCIQVLYIRNYIYIYIILLYLPFACYFFTFVQ